MEICPSCGKRIAPPPRVACPFCRQSLGQPLGQPAAAAGSAPPAARQPPTPTPSLPPAPAPRDAGDGLAWERRQQIGFGSALLETTRAVSLEPARFFASMPTRGGIGGPLLYGVLVGSLAFLLMIVTVLGLSLLLESIAPPTPSLLSRPPTTLAESLGALALWTVATPVMIVIALFVEAGISHLLLMMFGGAREPFTATFGVSCYGRAVTLCLAVPLVGWVAGPTWLIAVRVIGLRTSHRCGTGAALGAVLIPPLACCCLQVLLYFVFGLAVLALLAGAGR